VFSKFLKKVSTDCTNKRMSTTLMGRRLQNKASLGLHK
jgi:hypothetical protein